MLEEFLEDINNILNSGEVPNLFEPEEYEKIVTSCRADAKEAGVHEGDREAIFSFFINRVRNNLHIVLCMSPVGDSFRQVNLNTKVEFLFVAAGFHEFAFAVKSIRTSLSS